MLYDDSDNDGVSEVDLDFTGNITGLGDITLTTATVLETDFDDRLQTGSTTLSTAASVIKLDGTGDDYVTISIDSNNDGMFEDSLLTTWTSISGSDDDI